MLTSTTTITLYVDFKITIVAVVKIDINQNDTICERERKEGSASNVWLIAFEIGPFYY